jgi:hypothetical protein
MSLIASCFSCAGHDGGCASGHRARVELSSRNHRALPNVGRASDRVTDARVRVGRQCNGHRPTVGATTDGLRERWTGAPTFAFPRTYFDRGAPSARPPQDDIRRYRNRRLDRDVSSCHAWRRQRSGRDPGTGTGVFRPEKAQLGVASTTARTKRIDRRSLYQR